MRECDNNRPVGTFWASTATQQQQTEGKIRQISFEDPTHTEACEKFNEVQNYATMGNKDEQG